MYSPNFICGELYLQHSISTYFIVTVHIIHLSELKVLLKRTYNTQRHHNNILMYLELYLGRQSHTYVFENTD